MNKVEKYVDVKELELNSITLPICDGIVTNLNLKLIINYLDIFYNSLKYNYGKLIISGILLSDKLKLLDNLK